MSIRETIKTWKWRIAKTGKSMNEISKELNISPSVLSQYCSGFISPSIERFDLIEEKLKDLGV